MGCAWAERATDGNLRVGIDCMLRFTLLAALVGGCLGWAPSAAHAQQSAEPQETITKPAARPATERVDSISQGYYANFSPRGYFPAYVYYPNYPPKYPPLLGYGFGLRGYPLYRPRYIHGHPAGYLREHCPNDHKYGPVYYQSGMPVSGPVIEWLH